MFALLGVVLLEWACQLCKSDPTKQALEDFGKALQKLNPRYFTRLPAACEGSKNFTLPSIDSDPKRTLLAGIWDMIRNGQAHQYQDISVTLEGGGQWILMIRGVQHGVSLSELAATRFSVHHLEYCIDSDDDVLLYIHPGVFFLDIRDAIMEARLLDRGLKLTQWTKGGRRSNYKLTREEVVASLKTNSHGVFS